MFQFKLKPLLKLRENIEEMKKRELGKLLYEKQRLKNELKEVQQNYKSAEMQLKASLQGEVSTEIIQHFTHYMAKLKDEYHRIEKQVEKIESEIISKQDELREAIKERKILENLKDLHLDNYKKELVYEEQKIVDEVVSYKYAKRSEEELNA